MTEILTIVRVVILSILFNPGELMITFQMVIIISVHFSHRISYRTYRKQHSENGPETRY